MEYLGVLRRVHVECQKEVFTLLRMIDGKMDEARQERLANRMKRYLREFARCTAVPLGAEGSRAFANLDP